MHFRYKLEDLTPQHILTLLEKSGCKKAPTWNECQVASRESNTRTCGHTGLELTWPQVLEEPSGPLLLEMAKRYGYV